MKATHTPPRPAKVPAFLRLLLAGTLFVNPSCAEHSEPVPAFNPSEPAATYPADVAVAWLNLQLQLARTTPVVPAITFGRPYGYAGVVGYEAVAPGMPGYQSLAGQLNGLTGLPTADKTLAYSWALSANAALAAVNRSFFANTPAANLRAIDSLETTTQAAYQAGLGADVGRRSVDFGRKVAAAVWAWAKTDGYDNAAPYAPPAGAGAWVPTAPGFGPPAFPHWGDNRPLVAGSGDGADPGPPLAYAETAGSPFYLMAREVFDASQTLTPEQRATALFWNDLPTGRSFTPPGHWVSILAQVLRKENARLDKALLAYAKLGLCLTDAQIHCFKTKYAYSQLRPISYIRGPLGHPAWAPLFPTPAFPDYSSAHAVQSAAAAAALAEVFGPDYAFTDQSYAPFGLGTRSYASFGQAAQEAAISRFYGGIHYRPSCDIGQAQGLKIAQNISARVIFK